MRDPGAVPTTQCIDGDISAARLPKPTRFPRRTLRARPPSGERQLARFGQISELILVLPPVRQGDRCGAQMPVASPAPHLHHGLMLSTLKTSSPTEPGGPRRARHIPQRGGRFCVLQVKTRGPAGADVTRGKRLVVLVGQHRALVIAVEGAETRRRRSKLREWPRGTCPVNPSLQPAGAAGR
jgi:hypothetical protein